MSSALITRACDLKTRPGSRSSNQQGAVPAMDLVQVGRDIADGEAHAPVIAIIGAGAMDGAYMVDRELAGFE